MAIDQSGFNAESPSLAEKVLAYLYVKEQGDVPDWCKGDKQMFSIISGASEEEIDKAFEELVDLGFAQKKG